MVLFWKPRGPGLGALETGREPQLPGAPSATQGHFPLWSLIVGLRMMQLWLPGAHRKCCGLAVSAARSSIRQGQGACPFASVPPLQGGARPPPPNLGPFGVGGWGAVRRTFLGTPWRCGGSEASWRCGSAPGTQAPGVSRGPRGQAPRVAGGTVGGAGWAVVWVLLPLEAVPARSTSESLAPGHPQRGQCVSAFPRTTAVQCQLGTRVLGEGPRTHVPRLCEGQ